MPFPRVCITCAKPSHLRLIWKKSPFESVCMDLLKILDIDSSKVKVMKSRLYICWACVRLTEYLKVMSETCQANINDLLEYEEGRFVQMPIHSTSPNETAESRFKQTPIHSASPNGTVESRFEQTSIHSSSPNETEKSRFIQPLVHSASPNGTAKGRFKQAHIHSASPNGTAKGRFKQAHIHSASPNGMAKGRFKQAHIHSATPNKTAKQNSSFKGKTDILKNKIEQPKLSLKYLQTRRSTDPSIGILNEIGKPDLDVKIKSWDHTYAARLVEPDTGPSDDHITDGRVENIVGKEGYQHFFLFPPSLKEASL